MHKKNELQMLLYITLFKTYETNGTPEISPRQHGQPIKVVTNHIEFARTGF